MIVLFTRGSTCTQYTPINLPLPCTFIEYVTNLLTVEVYTGHLELQMGNLPSCFV